MENILTEIRNLLYNINKFFIKQSYSSIDNKFEGISNTISDYSIYTLVKPKADKFEIPLTFPRASYVQLNLKGSGKPVYFNFNSKSKEKITFNDGSYYRGVISKIFVSYDFTDEPELPEIQVYIGYGAEIKSVDTVKIDGVDVNNPLQVTSFANQINFDCELVDLQADNIFDINLSYPKEKIKSITIENRDTDNDVYVGNFESTNIETGTSVSPGEKLLLDLSFCSPRTLNLKVASHADVQIQYTVVTYK